MSKSTEARKQRRKLRKFKQAAFAKAARQYVAAVAERVKEMQGNG